MKTKKIFDIISSSLGNNGDIVEIKQKLDEIVDTQRFNEDKINNKFNKQKKELLLMGEGKFKNECLKAFEQADGDTEDLEKLLENI